jgi:hypothetical protein
MIAEARAEDVFRRHRCFRAPIGSLLQVLPR